VEVLSANDTYLPNNIGPPSLFSRLHDWANGLYSPSARWLSHNATFFTPKVLFSSQHLTNLTAFRVLVKRSDGSIVEPVRVFNPDRTGGVDTQGWGCTRHFQAFMYDGNAQPVVNLLLCYAMKKGRGISATLLLSPLDGPEVEWKPVFGYALPPPPPFPWSRLWLLAFELALAAGLAWLLRVAWRRGLVRRIAFAKVF